MTTFSKMTALSSVILGLTLLAAQTPVGAQEAAGRPNALPPGDGREIVVVACGQCHNATVVMKLREGPARWKHYVTDMILYGAQVQPQEVDAVVLYLTKNFGPTSQPIAAAKTNPAALPAGAGKELVETRCALCHDLERVTGIPRTAQDWNGIVTNMIGRGAVASADEARAITTYLTAHFGER